MYQPELQESIIIRQNRGIHSSLQIQENLELFLRFYCRNQVRTGNRAIQRKILGISMPVLLLCRTGKLRNHNEDRISIFLFIELTGTILVKEDWGFLRIGKKSSKQNLISL